MAERDPLQPAQKTTLPASPRSSDGGTKDTIEIKPDRAVEGGTVDTSDTKIDKGLGGR